jgi:hypothetical protein
MIKYILLPNTLPVGGEAPTGYHAQTVQSENRTKADFIRMMVAAKGGSSEGEAALWLDIVIRTVILELSQGRNVNIPGFINASVGLKGTFPDYESVFDPERNSLKANVYFSREITRALEHSAVSRVSEASSGMFIGNVFDVATGESDSALTPGNVLKIIGQKIKIAGDAPGVGVSFVNSVNEVYDVPVNTVCRNTARELYLVVPPLPAGLYKVKVTTQFGGNAKLLLEPRAFRYDVPLTVAS